MHRCDLRGAPRPPACLPLPALNLLCVTGILPFSAAQLFCVWLAYVLIVILKELCIVCASMYVVNVSLLALLIVERRRHAQVLSEKPKAA